MTHSLAGRWCLLPAGVPADQADQQRVDLVFHDDPNGLRGAVLARDGSEVALQSIAFDGNELRLYMPRHPNAIGRDVPFLIMRPVGDHFEGHWSAVKHLQLTLVRVPQ